MSNILNLERPSAEWDARYLELLCAAGMIQFAGGDTPAGHYWEFHDAIFHSATRMRSGVPQGGTYRFAGKLPPEPAGHAGKILRRMPGTKQHPEEIIDGYASNLNSLLARRQSTRSFDVKPIPFDALSRLMHSCFRTEVIGLSNEQEICSRPYPSGGALYETECYLIANSCADLPRGVYRYAGTAHEFHLIAAANPASDRILDRARWSCPPMDSAPPALLVLTARMGRIAWKYESIAYRTALLDAGVILQTLYLRCTELGLGCCAVGLGDSLAFAEATGVDEINEPSIAELALGLPRDL